MGVICCACDAMLALRVNVNGERRALVAKRAKMHVSAQRDFGALRKRDATPLPETSPQSVPAGQTQVRGKHSSSDCRLLLLDIDRLDARSPSPCLADKHQRGKHEPHAKWTNLSSKVCRVKREPRVVVRSLSSGTANTRRECVQATFLCSCTVG